MEDGDRAVLFDRRSRQTHILSPVARRAFGLLMAGPLNADELGRKLAEASGPHDDEPPRDADLAAQLLGTFDGLGLVEPAGL